MTHVGLAWISFFDIENGTHR